MLYAIEIMPPLGLVAWSVTVTGEMYQPFAPKVPAKFNVVTGGGLRGPEMRTMDGLGASTFPAASVAAQSIVCCPLPLRRDGAEEGGPAPVSRGDWRGWTPLPTCRAGRGVLA